MVEVYNHSSPTHGSLAEWKEGEWMVEVYYHSSPTHGSLAEWIRGNGWLKCTTTVLLPMVLYS